MRLGGPSGTNTDLALWRPETQTIGARRSDRLAFRGTGRPRTSGSCTGSPQTGWHFLEVRLSGGQGGRYTLKLARSG